MAKKSLSLLMSVVVLFSVFSFIPKDVQAAGMITYVGGQFVWGKGVTFVFDAPGYRNKDVRSASIFVGSNLHNLSCTANKDETKIVCVARGGLTAYAGETGIIYLAGQRFFVAVPDKPVRQRGGGESDEESGGESACAEPTVLGADVKFTDIDGLTSTEFIAGDTKQEVQAAADEMLAEDPDLVSYKIGDLYCGTETPEV